MGESGVPPAPLECAAGRAQLSQGKAVTWGNAWAGCHLCVPKPAGRSSSPLVAFSQRSLSRFPQFPSFLCHCTQPLVSSTCPERVPLSFPALPTSLPPSEGCCPSRFVLCCGPGSGGSWVPHRVPTGPSSIGCSGPPRRSPQPRPTSLPVLETHTAGIKARGWQRGYGGDERLRGVSVQVAEELLGVISAA